MYHLVYTSTATVPFTPPELEQFLARWRARNAQRDITGLLLYSAGNIMQVLEGEQPVIEQIFARIAQDLRHRNVTRLACGPIVQRVFREWAMGFRTPEPAVFRRLSGYADPDQQAAFLPPAVNPDDEGLLEMLREFAAPDVSLQDL